MATKRDIADFNVSELMRQMQGLKTKSSKENRWKAMLPELFSGLVSVYDQYQEDKLLEKALKTYKPIIEADAETVEEIKD